MATATQRMVTLSNAVEIPQLGFGVFDSPPELCVNSCLAAFQCGYRHIDTAQCYGNEEQVGEAVQKCGIPRREIFLTTKILEAGGSVEKSYESCRESVRKLDRNENGYVDLFLIHNAACGLEKYKEMWKALEKLHREGYARSIGVSNFGIEDIKALKEDAQIWPPHVNQLEIHPWLQQPKITGYCLDNGIAVEAYCPLVRNLKAQNDTLLQVARKHSVTPSQVLLRWSLQKGYIPLPKSDKEERIKANMDIAAFDLDSSDMKCLDSLDEGPRGALVQAV